MLRKILIGVFSVVILASCSSSDETAANQTMEEVVKEVTPAKKEVKAEVEKVVKKEVSAAPTTTETAKGTIVCKSSADERKIAVVPTQTGCAVQYEKFGNMQEVATATTQLDYCGQVQEKIQNNLTAAGFSCTQAQ